MEIGAQGELLHFYESSDAYCRQAIAFKDDITNLFTIPDEDFARYTPEERTNLVRRYCAVQYMSWTNRVRGVTNNAN